MDEPEIEYIETDTTCNICFAEFLDLEDLEIHKEQVHIIGLFTCQFCSSRQRNIDDYAIHIRDSHLEKLKFCQYCTRGFLDENYLKKHEKKHVMPNAKYLCSQCPLQFDNVVEIEKHEYTIHKYGDETNGQWLQQYMPHLSSALNMNLTNFLQSTKSRYTCIVCGLSSWSLSKYINHLKKRNCRSMACNTCYSVYKTRKGLLKHLAHHFECNNYMNANVTKKCSECLRDLPVHLLKHHQRHCKVIKCQKCQIVFEKMDDLSKHQMEKHPLVISVQNCKYCHKEFVGTVSLEKHIERSHNVSLYKYFCVHCELVFKHPQKLFSHFYSKHKEIEPYLCKICNKKFRIRKNFTIHIKLEHKSVGFVKFDEKFNVYFTDKKEDPNPVEDTTKGEISNTNAESTVIKQHTGKDIENANKDMKPDQDRTMEIINHASAPTESKVFIEIEIDKTPIDSVVTATDTEVKRTEEVQTDTEQTKVGSASKTGSVGKITNVDTASDSSDDQPLLKIRTMMKMPKRERPRYKRKVKSKHSRFTCKYCKKNCYTFQKYHQHMNTAHADKRAKCVKCRNIFSSKRELSQHIAKEHSSSKLTETLKNLLAKRKNVGSSVPILDETLTNTEKFQRTIKKVNCDDYDEPATLRSESKGLSVQKFIESFTPETNELKKEAATENEVTIGPVNCAPKKPFIKLTKFQPKTSEHNLLRTKLAMPVRFKPDCSAQTNVTVKVVRTDPRPLYIEQQQRTEEIHGYNDFDNYETIDEEKHDPIPEVAQEVLLEGSDETPKPIHKVVIPKIPEEISQIRIATLLPQAPYYKIVKINEVLKTASHGNVKNEREKDVKLPNGKKLVSVNPLAHLLKDTSIEKVMENIKGHKYYQPKTVDFEKAVAKALMNERPPKKRRKTTKVEP